MQPSRPQSAPARLRRAGRKLLLVPVLSVGLAVTVLPADAHYVPAERGAAAAQGRATELLPDMPTAGGRPAGVQTGRKSH